MPFSSFRCYEYLYPRPLNALKSRTDSNRVRQDVNQALVDDGLVDMDKIGISNFFWSFPSKVVVTRQNVVDSLTRDIVKVSEEIVIE